MIKKIIQNYKRRKTFFALRGYRKIIKQRKFKDLRATINRLHLIEIKRIKFNAIFMDNQNKVSNELILRQYLIQNLRNKFFYNYLIKMPMDSVCKENVEKLMKEHENKKAELEGIQSSSIEQMWLKELGELKKVYNEFLEAVGLEDPYAFIHDQSIDDLFAELENNG